MLKNQLKTAVIVANREAVVADTSLYFITIKSKAMKANMNQYNDPGTGCCGGLTDFGCC